MGAYLPKIHQAKITLLDHIHYIETIPVENPYFEYIWITSFRSGCFYTELKQHFCRVHAHLFHEIFINNFRLQNEYIEIAFIVNHWLLDRDDSEEYDPKLN